MLPCIAGHVGADAAGVILSEAPYLGEEVNLIVDIGTNAEIVLGNRDRLLAASSPTGPAFEGAQISCGQRAAPGAIERVRIDPETLEPRFRVIGSEIWSDDPAFAGTHVTGVCGSGIIEVIAELHLAGVLTTDGTIDGALAARSPRIVPDGRTFSYVLSDGEPLLTVTQSDIRQIQLAKAALHAGCMLLCERYGIDHVDRIRLAGAFGNHIDPVHALVLGLVPDCDPANVTSAGNAAGTGARIALLDRSRPRRDRGGRPPRREDRDRGRAALPGALRRRDGDPARHRSVCAAARHRRPAAPPRRRCVRGAPAPPRPTSPPGTSHDRSPGMTETTGGRRSGGRAARQAARAISNAVSVPYITRALKPFEVLSEEHLSLIEENADTVLEQVGIEFRDTPEALQLFKDAGADIDGERVRFPRGLARSIVQASAPATFTQVARNPVHTVEIGGPNTVLAPAYGSPFVRDLDNGRRYGTIEDFRNFVKLTYMTPFLHHSGGTVCEPVDVPVNKRHYDMVYAHMRYSDKAFMGSVTHPSRAEDTVAMARILFGADFLETNTVIVSLVNANSPMVWDSTMLGAAKAYAEANQGVLITPFILAGAMSPATVVGTATQTLAEALAGMAFCQLVRPGRAGDLRLVRVVDVDAVRRADLRHAGAGADALRDGGARAAARRPVPLRRRAHRLQDRRCPGRVRVGEHDAADHARRRQLRPPHGGLARGRAGDGVREVHPRRRPGSCVALAREGRGHVAERPGARCAADERARVCTSSGIRTRSRTSRARSGARRTPTTAASSSGTSTARRTRTSAPTRPGRRCSPSTRRRRSTMPSTRSCASSSSARRRPSPTRTPDGRERATRGRRRSPSCSGARATR